MVVADGLFADRRMCVGGGGRTWRHNLGSLRLSAWAWGCRWCAAHSAAAMWMRLGDRAVAALGVGFEGGVLAEGRAVARPVPGCCLAAVVKPAAVLRNGRKNVVGSGLSQGTVDAGVCFFWFLDLFSNLARCAKQVTRVSAFVSLGF